MRSQVFHEIYRKLAAARRAPAGGGLALDEFTQLCRERIRQSSSPDEWLTEADDCFFEIAQSAPLFAEAVSGWLQSDADIELAKALIHKASVRHLQQSFAETYNLSSTDEASAILAGCRLCALNATPAVSLGWALSLEASYSSSDKAQQAAAHLLEYHVNEFPWTTRRLLSSDSSPIKSSGIGTKGLIALNERDEWLDNMPRLREFAMTPAMRLTMSSLKRSENRAIQRSSMETSVLSQIFTAQHFKYANKTAIEFVVGDKVQETTVEMSPYRFAVELPVSERTDPLSGADTRRNLWQGLFR